MHQQSLERVDEFVKLVDRFRELWKSLVLRVGWTRANGVDMVLFLNATLEIPEPGKLAPPAHNPTVEGFNAVWEVRPADETDAFLDGIRNDIVDIRAGQLRVGFFQDEKFDMSRHCYSTRLSRHGEYYNDPLGFPNVSLFMSGNEIGTATARALEPEVLKVRWNALPRPFKDISDVLKNFFAVEPTSGLGINRTSTFVSILGRIPIIFESAGFEKEKIAFVASAPLTADLSKISIGRVIRGRREEPDRVETKPKPKEWAKKKGARRYQRKESARGASGFFAVLRYGGEVLDDRDIVRPPMFEKNPPMVAHEVFDPGLKILEEALSGRRKEHAFECAIGWLLSFCGFRPLTYGSVQLANPEVDVLAYAPEHNAILGVECTLQQPNIKDKMRKFFHRCQTIRGKLRRHHVMGALATPLLANEVPPADKDEAAENDIALLTGERLKQLLQMAQAGASSGEVLDFIQTCVPDPKRQDAINQIRRSMRKGFGRNP